MKTDKTLLPTYNLPDEKIARHPLSNRDEAKLLFYSNNKIYHKNVKDLPSLLPSNSLVILNNTKVIKARLLFKNQKGKNVEIFLTPEKDSWIKIKDQRDRAITTCLIGNKKSLLENEILQIKKGDVVLSAQIPNSNEVEFCWDTEQKFEEVLTIFGHVPIPPYLKREDEKNDETRYQTTFAKNEGSIAAPTASLHLTDSLLTEIKSSGHMLSEVTLHVGLGTFLPIKTTAEEHFMHSEFFKIPKETIEKIKTHNGPIIAFGTTATRTLESIPYIADEILKTGEFGGEVLQKNMNIEKILSKEKYCEIILNYLERENLNEISGTTAIFIKDDFSWKVVDGMLTNFHEPHSTLLCLVESFIGESWKIIYEEALNKNYRFLSYGDTSFLLRS